MSKRKAKETQEVKQYRVGDTIQIKGLDYRIVEVMPDGYHVKNTNPPFNSFIYVKGAGSIQGNYYAEVIIDELPQFQTPEELDELFSEVKNSPDLLYRPDDRISL